MPPHLTANGGRALMDLSGLAGELEREPEIRGYLRKDPKEEIVLFDDHIQDCVKHACFPHIHCILQIFLKKTIAVETMPQPPIHPLRDELRTLYNLCGRNPDDKTIIQDSWMIRKFLGLVKMKTRKEKVSTDKKFQELCLILNPGLQDLCDQVNKAHEDKLRKREMKASRKAVSHEAADAYDETESESSDGGESQEDEQEDSQHAEGSEAPPNQPVPAENPGVPTPSPPAPSATAAPSGEAADRYRAYLRQEIEDATATADTLHDQLAVAKEKLAQIRARKAHLATAISKMKSQDMDRTTTSAGQPVDVKKAPAIDQTETLPFDIMQAVPDDSLPSSNSPTIPSSELREQYQNTAQPKESPPGANVSKAAEPTPPVVVAVAPSAPKEGGGEDFPTRDDQLRLKATRKDSRKSKTNKAPPTGKGSKNAKKSTKRLSKKRKLLQQGKQSSTSSAKKARVANQVGENGVSQVKNRSSGSRDGTEPAPKATAKAKAKAKAKAMATPKAKASAKEKARKAKETAPKKGKGTGKGKGKGKGKPKTSSDEHLIQAMKKDKRFIAELVDELKTFATQHFPPASVVTSPQFKAAARALVPDFTQYRLNIYWTRTGVGVTSLKTGKDALHFSFTSSSAPDPHKLGVALKCAVLAVLGLEAGEAYDKFDGHDSDLTEKLKHNASLALFLLANKPSTTDTE